MVYRSSVDVVAAHLQQSKKVSSDCEFETSNGLEKREIQSIFESCKPIEYRV